MESSVFCDDDVMVLAILVGWAVITSSLRGLGSYFVSFDTRVFSVVIILVIVHLCVLQLRPL